MLTFLLCLTPPNTSFTNLRAGSLFRMHAIPLPTFKVEEVRLLGQVAQIFECCERTSVNPFLRSLTFTSAAAIPELVQVLDRLQHPLDANSTAGRWTFAPFNEELLLVLEVILEQAGIPVYPPVPLYPVH